MNSLRDRYLSALGIVQYRPRVERSADWPGFVESEPVVEKREIPGGDSGPTGQAETGRSHLDQLVTELEAPSILKSVVKPSINEANKTLGIDVVSEGGEEAPASGPSQAPQRAFRLACWRVSKELLVLDSLAPGERPNAPRIKLLGNILQAIEQQPDMLASAELLDWPLSVNTDTSLADARIWIKTFLEGRISQAPCRWVLAMGEAAIECLVPDDYQADAYDGMSVGQTAQGESFTLFAGITVLCVPGLAQMLEDPGTKALTWSTIRSLVPASVNRP